MQRGAAMDENKEISKNAGDVEVADLLTTKMAQLKQELAKTIIGQEKVINLVLNAILSNGHSLLVGVPGLAKTLLVQSLAKVLQLQFGRIQFTPDLMPTDIMGAEILDQNRQFSFVKGPIFTNLLLADEINRTPPKTQAALLEAMQEKKVTVGGKDYLLPKPFFTLATQNPIEQEGTYPLPEAQLDRFMYQVNLDYPKFEEEIAVVKKTTSEQNIQQREILSAKELLHFQDLVRRVPVAENVVEYAVKLTTKTRPNIGQVNNLANKFISFGAGPRASQFLIIGAKSNALLHGKLSPDIEDVQEVAPAVLRHRVQKNYKAEEEGLSIEELIQKLI